MSFQHIQKFGILIYLKFQDFTQFISNLRLSSLQAFLIFFAVMIPYNFLLLYAYNNDFHQAFIIFLITLGFVFGCLFYWVLCRSNLSGYTREKDEELLRKLYLMK